MKRLVLLLSLLFYSVAIGQPPARYIIPEKNYENYISASESSSNILPGTVTGQLLFWDTTTWSLTDGMIWNSVTDTLTVVNLDANDINVSSLTQYGVVKSGASGAVETLEVGATGRVLSGNTGADASWKIPTVDIPIILPMYDSSPARSSETNWNGGFLALATAQPLDSVPTDIVITKGTGKIVVVLNAGSDFTGSITITGKTIDRNTGASTPGDTDTLTTDTLTTDTTSTDTNGNTVHGLADAYISSKWFTGSVTLSTTNLTLTDVDVWHCSFEQFNDNPNIVLDTFDGNIFTTNVNAEFDAYLYDIHVTGDKCIIEMDAELHVGADGETAIANKYWRLRIGGLDEALDGLTDGVWVDVHYSNSPAYVEDVTLKLWATATQSLTFSDTIIENVIYNGENVIYNGEQVVY